MNNFLNLLLPLFVFWTLGCGAGSIYNPSYYSETSLEEDLYRVTFQGGRAPMTGDLCLLRCAEVTLSQGKEFFQVVDSESGNSFRSFPSSYPFDRHQIHEGPFVDDLAFVTKTIRMTSKEPISGFAYEAKAIESSLRRKYDLAKSQ
jgi:hypothetical protein